MPDGVHRDALLASLDGAYRTGVLPSPASGGFGRELAAAVARRFWLRAGIAAGVVGLALLVWWLAAAPPGPAGAPRRSAPVEPEPRGSRLGAWLGPLREGAEPPAMPPPMADPLMPLQVRALPATEPIPKE